MGMRATIVMAVALGMATPAFSQTLSVNDETLAIYVAESWANYGEGDSFNLDDVLLASAVSMQTPDATIAEFARRTGMAAKDARASAELIVTMAAVRGRCGDDDFVCPLKRGETMVATVERLGLAEPTGGLLFAAGTYMIHDEESFGSKAELAGIASRHPRAADLLARFYAYGHDTPFLIAMITSGYLTADQAFTIAEEAGRLPPESVAALLAAGRVDERILSIIAANGVGLAAEAESWDGWVEALLLDTQTRAQAIGPGARPALAQALLLTLLEAGLSAEAVSYWRALPAEVRTALPLKHDACASGAVCEDIGQAAYTLIDSMAAALWSAGHRDEARRIAAMEPDAGRPRDGLERERHDALLDAMDPQWPAADLFKIYLDTPAPKQSSSEIPALLESSDALSRMWHESPALRRVIAARLREAGYAAMADYLSEIRDPSDWSDWREAPPGESYAGILPARLAGQQADWSARRKAVYGQPKAKADAEPVRVSVQTLAPWWIERRLPTGMQAWEEGDDPLSPPKDLKLPVPEYVVVRYEETSSGPMLVYQSADYDLPGEIPAYGLWFVRMENKIWQRPVYLGLQAYFPYVITEGSRLPMWSGDGKLRLEARAEEIDADSISFPPVGLSLKRSESGLYLEFDLERLTADRDDDLMPDIEERRLGLDFSKTDTDGDGLIDGLDTMPLQRREASADGLKLAVARAIIEQLIGHDGGAIVVSPNADPDDILASAGGGSPASRSRMATYFLVADPDLFAPLTSPFRLMIYSEADLERLNMGAAPFFPPRIYSMFSSLDGRTHKITWSASWVGGTFFVRCAEDNTCTVETVTEWIT